MCRANLPHDPRHRHPPYRWSFEMWRKWNWKSSSSLLYLSRALPSWWHLAWFNLCSLTVGLARYRRATIDGLRKSKTKLPIESDPHVTRLSKTPVKSWQYMFPADGRFGSTCGRRVLQPRQSGVAEGGWREVLFLSLWLYGYFFLTECHESLTLLKYNKRLR